MAVFDGIQDLHEDILGKVVLSNVLAALGDVEEQVSLRAVLQDNVGAIRVINDLVHGHDIGVS